MINKFFNNKKAYLQIKHCLLSIFLYFKINKSAIFLWQASHIRQLAVARKHANKCVLGDRGVHVSDPQGRGGLLLSRLAAHILLQTAAVAAARAGAAATAAAVEICAFGFGGQLFIVAFSFAVILVIVQIRRAFIC